MKVERIKASTGLTLNLGNYESARVDVGAEAVLEEGDDIRSSYQMLFEICEIEVRDQVQGIQSDIAEKMRATQRRNNPS